MDCITFTENQSTERSLQLTVESKAVGLTQQVNEQQPKGLFRRIKTWFRRRFRPMRRHQTDGPIIEKQNNHLIEVSEYRPVGANTFAESSDGNADDTEPTHTDITSSMNGITRMSDELSTKSEQNKVTARKVQMDKGSERTTPLLTHRSLTEGTNSTDLKGIESSVPVMAGCVDTLGADSRGGIRSVSARPLLRRWRRRSLDRIADSIHAERDQSSTDSTTSQREERQQRNHNKSNRNGTDERKGSRSDMNRVDVESASAVRVEVSDDDIRVIAEDSIVPTDGLSIRDFKDRERKLKLLLKVKNFVRVKNDGDRRYVRKAFGRTSFWSRIRRLLCLGVAEHNQRRGLLKERLEAQKGREDSTNRRVHKSISDQHLGRKRVIRPLISDTPLRKVTSLSSECENNRLGSKKEWTSMKVAQHQALKECFKLMLFERERMRTSRIDAAFFETEPKESETPQLVLEKELSRFRQIGVSVFGTQHQQREWKRTEEKRRSISKSVNAVLPLLKAKGISLHNSIGKGGEAYIFKATYLRDQVSHEVAVKVSISDEHDFWTELKNMRGLEHRNVIRFFDISSEKRIPFVVFELAVGDMRSCYEAIIETTRMLPSIERMRLWSKDIVSGLQFIHRSGLLHNDIKMENILMVRKTNEPKEVLVPKIADFGMSKVCLTEDGNLIRGHNRYGTPNCSPPEGLILQEVEDIRLMDIWALGLIVFELLTDRSAFPVFSTNDFFDPQKVNARVELLMTHKATMQLSGLNHITEVDRQEIRTLLNRFLEPKVSQRESIDAIAKDVWFKRNERNHHLFKYKRLIKWN